MDWCWKGSLSADNAVNYISLMNNSRQRSLTCPATEIDLTSSLPNGGGIWCLLCSTDLSSRRACVWTSAPQVTQLFVPVSSYVTSILTERWWGKRSSTQSSIWHVSPPDMLPVGGGSIYWYHALFPQYWLVSIYLSPSPSIPIFACSSMNTSSNI